MQWHAPAGAVDADEAVDVDVVAGVVVGVAEAEGVADGSSVSGCAGHVVCIPPLPVLLVLKLHALGSRVQKCPIFLWGPRAVQIWRNRLLCARAPLPFFLSPFARSDRCLFPLLFAFAALSDTLPVYN